MCMSCINCKSENEVEATGIYEGFIKCGDCGFLKNKRSEVAKSNIILPDDPMDSFACESCQ